VSIIPPDQLYLSKSQLGHNNDKEEEGVRIMTMHSSKGLEAEYVFVPALEQDVFPGQSGLIEEKRRLFYVSMTRTKKVLCLSWARQRTGLAVHKAPGRTIAHGKNASQFIGEMN
jgi:superfamily I DNA/RNA helicase